jgi:hypothetical protein
MQDADFAEDMFHETVGKALGLPYELLNRGRHGRNFRIG